MKTEQGLVLPTTIIMLSVLALVVLSQLQAVFLVIQSLNQLQAKQQAFYQLEAAAHQLLTQAPHMPSNCKLPAQDPQAVLLSLKQHQGCQFWYAQQLYWYWLEDLGLFPCLQTKVNKHSYSTQHTRLSIFTHEETPMLLQLRLAKPVKLTACENQPLNLIPAGIVSWRMV